MTNNQQKIKAKLASLLTAHTLSMGILFTFKQLQYLRRPKLAKWQITKKSTQTSEQETGKYVHEHMTPQWRVIDMNPRTYTMQFALRGAMRLPLQPLFEPRNYDFIS